VTMRVWNFFHKSRELAFKDCPESLPVLRLDPAPSLPHASRRCWTDAASSDKVIRTFTRLVQVLMRPDLRFSTRRRGRVCQRSKESDPRFTGPVVLGPRAGRAEMHDACAGQEGSAAGSYEASAVVCFQDQGRVMTPEESLQRNRDVSCRSTGKGDPFDGISRCQVSHSQDDLTPSFDGRWRIGKVDGPHGPGSQPAELIESGSPSPAMPQSVLVQSALKRSTACPGQERPEGGHPDVGAHASEEIVNKVRCSRVERGLRATDRLQGIEATSPGVEGAGGYPKPPGDP
jgi:hypothetical protein